jgi:hypothetical protein
MDGDQQSRRYLPRTRSPNRIVPHAHNTISREGLTCLAKLHSLQAFPRDL